MRPNAPPDRLLQGSLELRHSGISGQMAATVLSLDSASGRVIQSKFKPDSQLSLAYSYPFRISEGWTTRLYGTNRTSEQVELCVFLHFEGQHYTWSGSKVLEPNEMRIIDIGELRDSQTMDEFGRLIPEDVDSGQFKLVIHSKDRSLVTAQAVIENAEQGLAFSTSCEICPPASLWLFLRKNRFDPEGTVAYYEGLQGQKERIYAVVQNEHGSTKDVSSWASYTSSNSSVASIKKTAGRADVEMNGPGFAALGASIFECIFYAPSFECEEGGCPCECQQEGFLTVPGSGLFGPETSPAAQVLVLPLDFEITTRAFIIPNHIGPDLAGGCLTSGGVYWRGDDRGFSATSSKFRAQHKVTYRSEPIGAILSNMRAMGQTRSYAPDAISNNGVIGPEDEDGTSGDCVLFHESDTASTSGMNVMETQSNGVRIFGTAANPLAPGPPVPINWDYTINFNAANPSQPTYSLTVTHDCYPGHEAYVGGQTIYTFAPSGNDIADVVSCLAGFGQITDIRSGTVQ